jgi:release factor glutamine methyltransferase
MAVDAATRTLTTAGVPSARHDAEALAAWVLGVGRAELAAVDGFTGEQAVSYQAAVERRANREPLQHIVGTAPFRYVEVEVGPGVFIPRPESEVVAGFAIGRAAEIAASGRSPLVVDLCTGSGAIAVAVVDEVPGAVVHAVELSGDAVAWARRNVSGTSVVLHQADATGPGTLAALDGSVDVVVSNPPYIPPGAHIRDAEVAEHDPPAALWGTGPDGLDIVRAVAGTAARLLRPGGWFVVEHADLQGESVPALLRAQGCWEGIEDHRDLTGRDRFSTAVRAGTEQSTA